jgi:hypothetical protein
MLRNVLAVLVGLVAGGLVNMALVTLGPALVPPPAGVDVTNLENLRATAHLLEPRHFVAPFLAHALGTFVGALTAFVIAGSRPQAMAWTVGLATLAGGLAAASMIPAPGWFLALDLVGAYVPMTWLAIAAGRRVKPAAARFPGAR